MTGLGRLELRDGLHCHNGRLPAKDGRCALTVRLLPQFGSGSVEFVLRLPIYNLSLLIHLRGDGIWLLDCLAFQLLMHLMILSLVNHQRVKLLIDLVNFGLTWRHEPALRVHVAKWALALLATLLFLVNYFIGGLGLNLVLYVNIVDQVEEHCEVLKSDAFDDTFLGWCTVCWIFWRTGGLMLIGDLLLFKLVLRTWSANRAPRQLDQRIIACRHKLPSHMASTNLHWPVEVAQTCQNLAESRIENLLA